MSQYTVEITDIPLFVNKLVHVTHLYKSPSLVVNHLWNVNGARIIPLPIQRFPQGCH